MYSRLLAVVFLGALVRAEASKLAVRIPSIPGGIEVRSLVGRELTFVTCDEQGLEVCGTEDYLCLKPGNSCCEWGGQCGPGTFCDAPTAGESGEPGCCPDGLDCDSGGGPGGTDVNIFTSTATTPVSRKSSASTHETTSTSTAVHVLSSVVSTSATKISPVPTPIATKSRNTGTPTNEIVPPATGLPTRIFGSGASGVSVQAGFVGLVVVIAGLFAP